MVNFSLSDIVSRISYGNDIYFKITSFFVQQGISFAKLKGLGFRLKATAPLDDLEKVDRNRVNAYWHDMAKKNLECQRQIFMRRDIERESRLQRVRGDDETIEGFDRPGSLLHIDGDKEYLDLCLTTYKQLGIPCHGYHINEENQAENLMDLLVKHKPDMLVLTGHDGLVKGAEDYRSIRSYHNSKYFTEAIKVARTYEKSLDDLIIFAGACQSHYEALLDAGANFASSPKRVLIHAYDPVFVMEKIAYTSIYEQIVLKDVISGTVTGFDGIGGLETRGKYRLGLPKSPYS